jgi:hypothetical protein
MYTVPHSWNSARIFQAAADTSSVQPASSSRLINYPSVYIQRGVMETPRQCLVQSTNFLSDKRTFQHEGFRTPSWITQRILMKVVVVGSDSPWINTFLGGHLGVESSWILMMHSLNRK